MILKPKVAEANNFQMQTGYYMGSGSTQSITGLGFQPEFILIKSNTNAGEAVFKTSAMPSANTAFTGGISDNTSNQLSINSNGFTVGTLANVNSQNVRYQWVAFAGNDCSSNGTFCVGQYTGNGAVTRNINTGFQPDLVIVKRTTAVAGNFRTSSYPNDRASYFTNLTDNTTGGLISSFYSSGFTVGSAINNVSGGIYNYIAFKNTSNIFQEGVYTGNAADNRNISSVGFKPDFVFVKNSTHTISSANRNPVMNLNESYGDSSSFIGSATANSTNLIQELQSDGFQIGSSPIVNGNGDTIYYAAFGGAPSPTQGIGTFEMINGTYTGTGSEFSINNLPFAPDLVLIKDDNANLQVFRTRMMNGDITAHMSSAADDFAQGIRSLNSDGFTLGTSSIVNTNGNTYQWVAFGNAWNPHTQSGSSDFSIGVYYGNAIDNRNITRLPFEPNFVTIKRNAGSAGTWRSSGNSGDQSSFFAASGETSNFIQGFNSDGFEIGSNGAVNTANGLFRWFAFKHGSNFISGSYIGDGSNNRNIGTLGFQPDLIWIKRNTAIAGVSRPSSLFGNLTQYFTETINASDRIKNFILGGVQLGSQTEVNTGSGTYRYAAWYGKKYDQRSYRFFENNNSTDVGPALEAIDTETDLNSSGQAFRLRMLVRVDNGNLFTSSQDFKLQFSEMSGLCDINFTGENYIDVTNSTPISFNDNPDPADGEALTPNVNDITDGTRTIVNQTYQESNNFTNSQGLILNIGQTGHWDFSLIDNNAPVNTSYCFRIVKSNGVLLDTYTTIPKITTSNSSGNLSVGIVDNLGTPVGSPSISMIPTTFSFTNQTATGTFGTPSEIIRVNNGTGTATWTLSLSAEDGPTSLWSSGSNFYDFNDPTADASDGADSDSYGGQMTIDPSSISIAPQSGCTSSEISSGSNSSFNEGVTNSITIASASSGAQTNCFWDISGINISQTIPKEQTSGNYSLDMTLSIIAS